MFGWCGWDGTHDGFQTFHVREGIHSGGVRWIMCFKEITWQMEGSAIHQFRCGAAKVFLRTQQHKWESFQPVGIGSRNQGCLKMSVKPFNQAVVPWMVGSHPGMVGA